MKTLEKELSRLRALSKKLQKIRHNRATVSLKEKEGMSRRLARILSALKPQMQELARLKLRVGTTTATPPASSTRPQRGLPGDQLEDSAHSTQKNCKNSNYYRTMKSSPLCSRKLSAVNINISLHFLTPSRMR